MRSGGTKAKRPEPGSKPPVADEAPRLLSAAEEARLVADLCALRSRIQRKLNPLLKSADEGTRLDHFDQQLAYYSCRSKIRATTRRRIEELLGDYNAIKHRLVLANLPWVTKLSRSHRNSVIAEEDLFQEGICGLLKAIDRFEAKRGLRLMTYATWYIREAMQQVRARQSHTVALSAHDQTLLGDIENRRSEFQHQNRRPPSHLELAQKISRKADFLVRLQSATTPAVSLERNSTEGTIPVAVEDPSSDYEDQESVSVTVSRLLETLPSRERLVVTRRFGLEGGTPTSLETLGGVLNVSKERVRQLQRQALRRMQESADAQQLDLSRV